MSHEATVTANLHKSINELNLSLLKSVSKKRAITGTDFKDAMTKWYGQSLSWPLVEPDLILVFEDVEKKVDDVMIVAIEIKYFDQSKDLHKRLRQSFREVGQPLRNLIFGFDSAVLWHIFSPEVAQERIESYTNIVDEVISKLKLPMVYFATTIKDSELQIHKPFGIPRQELQSTIMWLQNLCADKRSLPTDPAIIVRRKSLKLALRVPT